MRNQIFISYSHQDVRWLKYLQTMLKPLVRNKTITVWDDTHIQPGMAWREAIKQALNAAYVAVLLVSPDFLASDFIAEHELPPLLEAAEKEGLTILWVAVRPSLYRETCIEHYQAANDPAKPLSKLKQADRDLVLVHICEQIKRATQAQLPGSSTSTENAPIAHDRPAIHEETGVLTQEDVIQFFKEMQQFREDLFVYLPKEPRAPIQKHLRNGGNYVSSIPQPPYPYIVHPYTLLQTPGLIGRQTELKMLTDWVTKPASAVYNVRIFNIVGLGGMGKSALTWTWFNDIAPQEMHPLAGRLWWSFYENKSFDNFVIHALAYISRRSPEEVQEIVAPEREAQLLAMLDQEPYLLVLDGMERMLIAYDPRAGYATDSHFDEKAINVDTQRTNAPGIVEPSLTAQFHLHKTAEYRVGNFLRKLTRVRSARILVTSRLYPADLQSTTSESLPGSFVYSLEGLNDDDALGLWGTFHVNGTRKHLLRLFETFDKFPLLIQTLAGEVARYRHAPGNFDAWQRAHPDFNPFVLPLIQAQHHVLEIALQGLNNKAQWVLQTISAFRSPATYEALVALFVGNNKLLTAETDLNSILSELEGRGLVGWDRRANRYSMHPVVRGVTRSHLDTGTKQEIYTSLRDYFETLSISRIGSILTLEDLIPNMELYNSLINLELYEVAYDRLHDDLVPILFFQLSTGYQQAELLEMLFTEGVKFPPRLKSTEAQSFILNALGLAYGITGRLSQAIEMYRRSNDLDDNAGKRRNVSVGLCNLANALYLSGSLYEAEVAARSAICIARPQRDRIIEASGLRLLGIILVLRGMANDGEKALRKALSIFGGYGTENVGLTHACLSQRALWLGLPAEAYILANRAFKRSVFAQAKRNVILTLRLQGQARLELDDWHKAEEQLHDALIRARTIGFVEEEIQSLVALAELRRRQGNFEAARQYLDDVWEPAQRGPYPLFLSDAFNILAQIERDLDNQAAALEATLQAHKLAYCDGPPFAYHWGLEKARIHLRALNALEPEVIPFNHSKYDPMTEVKI